MTKLKDTADTFSIGELLRTLFKPYRQLGMVGNSVSESRVNVFIDKLVSRLVGAVTRMVLILAGIVTLIAEILVGGVMLALWPMMPMLPIVGVVLAVVGVTL